jgi:mono/diheme cytochrome c family protein
LKRTNLLALLLTGIVIGPSLLHAQSDSARLFKSKCVLCHAEDGSGNSPSGKALKAKDLRLPETRQKSDAEIADVITKGRNKMPAFGHSLKPEQIQQLVTYIRQLAKK